MGHKHSRQDILDCAVAVATEEGLSELVNELSQLVTDVLSENQRSFRKLAEARVDY